MDTQSFQPPAHQLQPAPNQAQALLLQPGWLGTAPAPSHAQQAPQPGLPPQYHLPGQPQSVQYGYPQQLQHQPAQPAQLQLQSTPALPGPQHPQHPQQHPQQAVLQAPAVASSQGPSPFRAGSWTAAPFVFDPGTPPVGPQESAEVLAPSGWQPSPVTWQRLHDFEALQGESLFSVPLPQLLAHGPPLSAASPQLPNTTSMPALQAGDSCATPVRSKSAAACGSNPGRLGTSPAPQPGAELLHGGGVHRHDLGVGQARSPPPTLDGHSTTSPSKQELQPLLPGEVSADGEKPADELSFTAFQKGFQSAWSTFMNSFEALSAGWCSHQANSTSPPVMFNAQLEFKAAPQPDAFAWYVQSVPPTDPSAQRGGAGSPVAGFRAEGYEAIVDPMARGHQASPQPAEEGSEADQRPAGPVVSRRAPADRVLPQREIIQAMVSARCSVCSLKGNKSSSPNQDRGLCASLADGTCETAAELLAVFDGHGEGGHMVAETSCEVLPKLFLRCLERASSSMAHPVQGASRLPGGAAQNPQEAAGSTCPDWWREASVAAFEEMHALLEASTARLLANEATHCARPLIDARTSGTTATVALLLPDQRLLLAHVGDSRAVFGSRRRCEGAPWQAIELTRDHKPDLPDERVRIEETGAQVVTVGSPPNTTHRVFTPHQAWPSINMSRSLGDLHAHSQGLSAAAEVNMVERLWHPGSEDAVIILGSDGVWDVIDAPTAVNLAALSLQRGNDPAAVIAQEAYERWVRRGLQAGYSDDITAVVKFL